jgi:hypothetical protein
MEEDKGRRRKEGEGTKGGEGREDKRREGRLKGPQDVWQIAAPVTYKCVRRFCVVQHALLDITALWQINY